MANYPTSDPSFPTRNAGETITPEFFNGPNAEITAIGAALRGTLQHDLTLATSKVLTVGGGQIAFPATQNPSSDANTLDDYAEGTWTPTLSGASGSGITYTTNSGQYIKIGKLVFASFSIATLSLGTASGGVSLSGLPFTADATHNCHGASVAWAGMTSNVVGMWLYPVAGTTTATFGITTAAGTTAFTAMTIANMGATTTLRCAFTYRASA